MPAPQLTAVERSDTRLVNEVYERLREAISSGRIAPETRLLQQQLADSLGVSRTPLREALLRLEREGFLYTLPGRGMFVRRLTIEQIIELYQLREALEPFAARLACEAATTSDIARVEAIQSQHERRYPSSVLKAFQGNFDLHTSLVKCCPNRRIYEQLRNVWDQNSAFLIFSYYTHSVGSSREMVCEHRAIVDAFAAGKGSELEELLRGHIRSASASLRQSLSRHEPQEREA
ncbi:MAG: GntR family transcriptional regulator [Acidimicrobiales bacterium]